MSGRILVIRGGALGDFILTLPAIGLLRAEFPGAHIEILGYQSIVTLAEGRHYATATRSIEYGPLSRFFIPDSDLPKDLADYFSRFDSILSYLYDPDGFFEGNLRRAGARHILQGPPKIRESEHAAHQLARPLEQLALFLEDPSARVFPSEADHSAAEKFLGDCDRPLLALHPGSGSETKNWPLGAWEELGATLASSLNPSPLLLLIGGEADVVRLASLRRAWADLPLLTAENLPLPTLAALLSRARLFVGHDSGVSHLAAAADARCLLLFGRTNPTIWAPANPRVTVLRAPGGNLAALPGADVEQTARALWEAASGVADFGVP